MAKIPGLIILLLLLLSSCAKHGDLLYEARGITLSKKNNGQQKDITDSIPANAFAIKLTTQNEVTDYTGGFKDTDEGHYRRKYSLLELKIFCLQNFDASHPANSDISGYFLYQYGTQYTLDYFIENNIIDQPGDRMNPAMTFEDSDSFMLMKKPQSPGVYTFKLFIRFEDHSNFTDTISAKLTY